MNIRPEPGGELASFQPPVQSRADWGQLRQLATTKMAMQDLPEQGGNADGIWGNENQVPGSAGGGFTRGSLAAQIRAMVQGGLSANDEIAALSQFVNQHEVAWGQPVLDTTIANRLRAPALFRAQKAIALVSMGLTPADVQDEFINAKGKVAGRDVPPREIFVQHFKADPEVPSKNTVLVISPGYEETGRNFYDMAGEARRRGYDVLVMDHQWAGQTGDTPGKVDSGFGVARDVAAVSVRAQELATSRYKDKGSVAIIGNSMGAGPGAIGAVLMAESGEIELGHGQMPQDIRCVAMATYMGPTPTPKNSLIKAMSHLPLLNNIKLPMIEGLPNLADDPVVERKISQGAVAEDINARLSAFSAVDDVLEHIESLAASSTSLQGRVAMLHSSEDVLACHELAARLASSLGVEMKSIAGREHVLAQNPRHKFLALDMLEQL